MIGEFEFNNYRFFKGRQTLSFGADQRTKKLLSNSTQVDGKRTLKCIGLYGQNNGGKTNIVALFSVLRDILKGQVKGAINNQSFHDERIVSLSVTFNNQDGKGWLKYSFSFDNSTLAFLAEELSEVTYYSNGAPFEKVIFEKDFESKRLTVFGQDASMYLDILPAQRPLLYSVETKSGYFATLAPYLESLVALADSIEIVPMYNIPLTKTLQVLKKNDPSQAKFVRSFVQSADLSITDFSYSPNSEAVLNLKGRKLSENALAKFAELEDAFRLTTTYGKTKVPSLVFDSAGTKKIEAVASYVYEAIAEGKTLIIDEIDNGLHFNLTRAIVSAFNNLANKRGQLFFTAHDLLLINCKSLLRKDQIYFVQRTNKGANLYCLKEATVASGGPREGDDLLKHYNRGDFGPVPTPSFIKDIISIQSQDPQRGGNQNGVL